MKQKVVLRSSLLAGPHSVLSSKYLGAIAIVFASYSLRAVSEVPVRTLTSTQSDCKYGLMLSNHTKSGLGQVIAANFTHLFLSL